MCLLGCSGVMGDVRSSKRLCEGCIGLPVVPTPCCMNYRAERRFYTCLSREREHNFYKLNNEYIALLASIFNIYIYTNTVRYMLEKYIHAIA